MPARGWSVTSPMRSICVLGTLALAASANAGTMEPVATVKYTDDFSTLRLHEVGDARYMALKTLARGDTTVGLDVLDLKDDTTLRVATQRAALERELGVADYDGELVSFNGPRAGLHIADGVLETAANHWYVEIDRGRGTIVRRARLATLVNGDELHFIGPHRCTTRCRVVLRRAIFPSRPTASSTRSDRRPWCCDGSISRRSRSELW